MVIPILLVGSRVDSSPRNPGCCLAKDTIRSATWVYSSLAMSEFNLEVNDTI